LGLLDDTLRTRLVETRTQVREMLQRSSIRASSSMIPSG
jgi:hypothetical protein